MIFRNTVWVLPLLALMACGGGDKKDAKEQKTEEAPLVKVQQVHTMSVDQEFVYTATTEADKVNNISSSMPLRIKSILVDEGQNVAKGQRLVVLDDVNTTSYELQLSTAQANLRNVEADYNRADQLFKIGGGTKQAVDQLATQLATARNQVSSARRALENAKENSVLTSPVSGVVTARNYDPGDMTGTLPILTIAQVRPVKLIINVSETEYSKIHIGMEADIKFDTYGDEQFTGRISKIMPTVDAQTRTFGVEITLPNPGGRVLPGMFGRVTLNLGTAQHVVIPDQAVVKQQGSGDHYVYIYDPKTSTVDFVKVELGQRLGNTYELVSGVPDGAQVVTTGQNALAAGRKVRLQ